MSKPLRMSRRAVLVAIGLTPAVLFSIETKAEVKAKIEAWANNPNSGVLVPSRPKVSKACEHLWNAATHGMRGIEMDTENDVLDAALRLAGPKIHLNIDSFDANGYHDKTMSCAGICGYLCAEEAIAGASKITPEIFEKSYYKVHEYVGGLGYMGLAC